MATHALAPAVTVFNRAFGAISHGLRVFAQNLAYARMVQTLHGMSDAQLARIGVARADIPAHALALTRDDAAGSANLN